MVKKMKKLGVLARNLKNWSKDQTKINETMHYLMQKMNILENKVAVKEECYWLDEEGAARGITKAKLAHLCNNADDLVEHAKWAMDNFDVVKDCHEKVSMFYLKLSQIESHAKSIDNVEGFKQKVGEMLDEMETLKSGLEYFGVYEEENYRGKDET